MNRLEWLSNKLYNAGFVYSKPLITDKGFNIRLSDCELIYIDVFSEIIEFEQQVVELSLTFEQNKKLIEIAEDYKKKV